MIDEVFVTEDDILRYTKAQLKRAKINLLVAEQRNDVKAAHNIERKIAIYEKTLKIVEYYSSAGEDILKKILESGD